MVSNCGIKLPFSLGLQYIVSQYIQFYEDMAIKEIQIVQKGLISCGLQFIVD